MIKYAGIVGVLTLSLFIFNVNLTSSNLHHNVDDHHIHNNHHDHQKRTTHRILGGFSGEEVPNTAVKNLFKNVYSKIQSTKSELKNVSFSDITILSYKVQIVNGYNYIIKFKVNTIGKYFETKIYQDFKTHYGIATGDVIETYETKNMS